MLLSAGPEEGAGAAGIGITGGGELPDKSGGNRTQVLCWSTKGSERLGHLSSPQKKFSMS